jgi:hypothetical protein
MSDRPTWRLWLTLAGVAAVGHGAWEVLQLPLYTPEGPGVWAMLRGCGRATVGDVVLTIVAYAVVAAFVRDWWWLLRLTPGRVAAFLAIGLSLSATLEAISVYVWKRWTYGPSMPLLFGIGVAPLLQWMVVPLVVLIGAARAVRR